MKKLKFKSQIIGWNLSLMSLSFKLIKTRTKKFQKFLKTKNENPKLSCYQLSALNNFPNSSVLRTVNF